MTELKVTRFSPTSSAIDLREYVNPPDFGPEDMNLTETAFNDLLYAVSEFFNPNREAKTYFIVGKEKLRVPGNAVVMTANSKLVASLTNQPKSEIVLLPDMIISQSYMAFASAWLFINGMTPNPHGPYTWGFTTKDHVQLYFWFKALQVDLRRIEMISEWFSSMISSEGERYKTKLIVPNYRAAGGGIHSIEQVDKMTREELKAIPAVGGRFLGIMYNAPGMVLFPEPDEKTMKDWAKANLFEERDVPRMRFKGSAQDKALLARVYEDLAPTCQAVIDSGFNKQLNDENVVCFLIDEIAELTDKPRLDFQEKEQAAESKARAESDQEYYRVGSIPPSRVISPEQKLEAELRVKRMEGSLQESKIEKIEFKKDSAPDLSSYATYSVKEEDANSAQATIQLLSPSIASNYLYEFIMGSEAIKVYGDALVGSIVSPLMARLYQSGGKFPPLASHMAVSKSPRSFVKIWLYVNGVTTNNRRPLYSENLSFAEKLQMWQWLNYFNIDINDASVQGFIRDMSIDALALNDELSEENKLLLTDIASKIKLFCKDDGHGMLCDANKNIRRALGIKVEPGMVLTFNSPAGPVSIPPLS